jgi:hypothetical protein
MNEIAVNANRNEAYYKQCYVDQSTEMAAMKIDNATCRQTITSLNATIEAFRMAQPIDLQTRPVGLCTDFKCGQAINKLKDTIIAHVRELDNKEMMIQEMKEECSKAKQNSVYWKEQHSKMVQGSENNDMQPTTNKRMREDVPAVVAVPKPRDLEAKMTDDLSMRFNVIFMVTNFCNAVLDENTLYDNFFMDQPEKDRLQVIEEMFSACHDGSKMPERDRKKFRSDLLVDAADSSRIGKRSFAACLKAMGGIPKRKYAKTVWVNVHMRRPPMFQRMQLERP